jgi:hypothetical protein
MSVHECARRANRLAKFASKLDNNIGQHHWPAALASNIITCQQHSAAPVVSTTDRHHWPDPLAACSKHVDDDDDVNAAEAQIHAQTIFPQRVPQLGKECQQSTRQTEQKKHPKQVAQHGLDKTAQSTERKLQI